MDDDGDGAVDEETLNGLDDDRDGEIDEDLGLFAQQMMTSEYADDRPEGLYYVYEGSENHRPLGLTVHQEAYAWSAPGYQGIAGLSFRITNHGREVLRDVRIGMLADLDSRDRNDRGGHINDRVESMTYSRTAVEGQQRITVGACTFGADELPTCRVCTTELSQTLPVLFDRDPRLPMVAVIPLEHTTDPLAFIDPVRSYARAPGRVSFTTSVFDRGRIPEQGGLPNVDRDRYAALRGAFPTAAVTVPGDFVVLVSCGPFPTLAPGQELSFDVALVAAFDRDSLRTLMGNAAVLHHGFTLNRIPDVVPDVFPDEWFNGISGRTGHEACIEAPPRTTFQWDPHCPQKFGPDVGVPDIPVIYAPGECIWTDADCDLCTGIAGLETRVRWLDPGNVPAGPSVRTLPLDHGIRIEWDNRPEILAAAGLAGAQGARFTGYRLYKLADWRDRKSLLPPRDNWALLAAFGPDTRNSEIPIGTIIDTALDYERILYEQKLYPVGRYAVVDSQVLNGFDYAYAVTTVLERDRIVGSVTLTDRYESVFAPRFDQIVRPAVAARERAGTVWVVPNPFRASETWQRPTVLGDPLTRHIDFMGLPRARSRIKIWTVAGDHVVTIDHDGSQGNGEAAWNLVSRNGQEIESGIYLFTVDSPLGQEIGRFVVIR